MAPPPVLPAPMIVRACACCGVFARILAAACIDSWAAAVCVRSECRACLRTGQRRWMRRKTLCRKTMKRYRCASIVSPYVSARACQPRQFARSVAAVCIDSRVAAVHVRVCCRAWLGTGQRRWMRRQTLCSKTMKTYGMWQYYFPLCFCACASAASVCPQCCGSLY